MGWLATLYVILGYFVFSLLFLPMQYKYVVSIKEERKKREEAGIKENNLFEEKPFDQQVLHANVQGNILFIGANLMAEFLYYLKHRKGNR